MKMRTRVVLFLLFLSVSAIAGAATVSVFMFETGISEDAPKIEATSAWESGVLDTLFNGGHIVTNGETKRLATPGLPAKNPNFAEAIEGGADMIVYIELDYDASANAGEKTRICPRSASARICDKRGSTIFRHEVKILAPTKSGAEDEQNAKSFARPLDSQLKKGR